MEYVLPNLVFYYHIVVLYHSHSMGIPAQLLMLTQCVTYVAWTTYIKAIVPTLDLLVVYRYIQNIQAQKSIVLWSPVMDNVAFNESPFITTSISLS